MSASNTEFINLNEVFLPATGGLVEGNVEVNGILEVNDQSGNGTTYDVAAELSKLNSAIGDEAALPYIIVTFQGEYNTEVDREASVFPTFATLMKYFNNRQIPDVTFVYSDDYGGTSLERSSRLDHYTQYNDQTCNAMMFGTPSQVLFVTDGDEVLTDYEMGDRYSSSAQ